MANTVEIILKAIDQGLEHGLTQAHEKASGLGGALGAIAPVALAAGTALGGAFALGEAVNKVDELGTSIKTLQTRIGGTAEDASRIHFALHEVGIDAETAEKGFGIFFKALETGSPHATSAMQTLGVAFKDSHGQARPMNDLLLDLADKFQKMPNGAEKTALAMELFGKSGAGLLPFLNKGREGIAELEHESDKLGLTLSGQTLDAIKKNTMAHREFDAAMEGVQVQLGVMLLPLMTLGAEGAVKLAVAFNAHVVPAIHAVVPVIKEFAEWFGKIKDLAMTDPFKALEAAFDGIGHKVQEVAPKIGEALKSWAEAFVHWADDHKVQILEAIAALIAPVPVALIAFGPKILGALEEWTKQFVKWAEDNWPPLEKKLGEMLQKLGDWIIGPGLDRLNENLPKWTDAFAQWVVKAVPPMVAELVKLGARMEIWILTEAIPKAVEALTKLSLEFSAWVATKAIPALVTELGKLIEMIISWVTGTAVPAAGEAMGNLGKSMMDGLGKGIQDHMPDVGTIIKTAFGPAGFLIAAAADAIGAHSPSTLWSEKIGMPIMDGIAQAIMDGKAALISKTADTLTSTIDAAKTAIMTPAKTLGKSVADYIGDGLQPELTTVLDNAKTQMMAALAAMKAAGVPGTGGPSGFTGAPVVLPGFQGYYQGHYGYQPAPVFPEPPWMGTPAGGGNPMAHGPGANQFTAAQGSPSNINIQMLMDGRVVGRASAQNIYANDLLRVTLV